VFRFVPKRWVDDMEEFMMTEFKKDDNGNVNGLHKRAERATDLATPRG